MVVKCYADHEGEVNEYQKALLRVGQLREIGMPEEEIIQPMMSEKFCASVLARAKQFDSLSSFQECCILFPKAIRI
jgi:hypothetical protein